jgi:hypothetical protein
LATGGEIDRLELHEFDEEDPIVRRAMVSSASRERVSNDLLRGDLGK